MNEKPKNPYRRRYGLIYRPWILGSPERPRGRSRGWINDGGEDEPLSPRGRTHYRELLLGIFVVFVVLVLLTARGY